MTDNIIDPNCIIKAFQNQNVSIIQENNEGISKYHFRGTDIAKALGITNIRSSIQNFTDKEKGVRKVDTLGGPQEIIFLSSQGLYRLLYSSKKKVAEEFREWVGNILDDIIFNESKLLKEQLKKHEGLLLQQKIEFIKDKETILIESYDKKHIMYLILINDILFKFGWSNNIKRRLNEHKNEIGKDIQLIWCIESKDNILLEKELKEYISTTTFRKEQIFITNTGKEKNQTELIEINDISIIQNKIIEMNKYIELDKSLKFKKIENLNTKIKQLELENKQLKNKPKQINVEENVEENVAENVEENENQTENILSDLNIKKIKKIKKREIEKDQQDQEEIQLVQENQEEIEKEQINKEVDLPENTKEEELLIKKREEANKRMTKYRKSEKYKQFLQSVEYKEKEKKRYERRKQTEKFKKNKKEYYQNNKVRIDAKKLEIKRRKSKSTLAKKDDEKEKFNEWLNLNIKQENDGRLIWKEVIKKYLDVEGNLSPLISGIYKQYFIEYYQELYPDIKVKYTQYKINDKSCNGFKNFVFKVIVL